MHPGFAHLEGGLFSTVSKADVGEGAGALIERGVDIMAWADPFFPDPSIPERVKRVMIDAIAKGTPSHYSMPIGRRELREAIAAKVSRQTGLVIDPGRNVIVTPGSDTGLLYAMMPFITPGAEVLVPEPSYPNNLLDPALLGGITVPVPLRAEDNYQLRAEELEERLTPATRMVVLCQPNNPTTTVFRRENLEMLARFVVEHDLMLVCDQAFEDHVYDGIEFVAPATLPGMWERTLTVCSVSKGLGLSGFRVGYIYAHDAIMDVLYGGAVNVLGTAATVTSIGATEAIRDTQILEEIGSILDRRRKIAYEILSGVPGVSMRIPESGILAWLDVSALGTSAEITSYLLEEANVLVNPGSQYGEHGEGHIRLVFAVFADESRARYAYERIATALGQLARSKGVA
jgi:aspartate/methionine/tyrosine aminotransferase